MGYSPDDYHVRCDVFKPSGKWYATVCLDMAGHYEDIRVSLPELVRNLFMAQLNKGSYRGFWIVVLEPCHIQSYPVMIKIPEDPEYERIWQILNIRSLGGFPGEPIPELPGEVHEVC